MFTYNNLRKNRFGIFVFLILFVMCIIFIWQKQNENEAILRRYELAKNTVPPLLYENIKKLKDNLLKLEFENSIRMQEMLDLRRKLKEKFNESSTDILLSLPNIYSRLPHLLGHNDALAPYIHLTKNRKASLVFGVPTVYREHSYLNQMLTSMITGLNDKEKEDVLIVVFVGERNEKYINEVVKDIKDKFKSSLESGLLEVIVPSPNYYPPLDELPSTFNDPPERVKWRAKQNLDYAFLMMYAQPRAVFYVQLEDDIIATPGYATTIKAFAMQQATNNWFMLEFSSLGFIGKTFHSYHLSILVEFFLIFYKYKPNDWLLDHIFWVKVCNPEGDDKQCQKDKALLRVRFKPSLFQHIGKLSSLKGKKQNLVDKEFKTAMLFQAHLNPKAVIKTNFEEYQTFTAVRGYLGHSYLWALTPKKDQVLRILFSEPQKVVSYLFKTGNPEHPTDILTNATVEALTLDNKQYREKNNGASDSGDISSPFINSDYIILGLFNENGLAFGKVSNSIGLIAEIRIRVLESMVENWVAFYEIFIETGS